MKYEVSIYIVINQNSTINNFKFEKIRLTISLQETVKPYISNNEIEIWFRLKEWYI